MVIVVGYDLFIMISLILALLVCIFDYSFTLYYNNKD